MADRTPVFVAGAGPVGLTAALILARAGVAVRVVDAGPAPDRRMRASTFHPPTLDMIEDLGLGQSLVGLGLTVPVWQMRQHETGEHVDFDLRNIADVTAHPYRLQIEQHHYCSLLLDALAELGCSVEFGNAVVDLRQNDEHVDVSLADSTTQSASWLIGADGANSTVRKSLALEYGGKTYTHSSVLVSTTFPFHEYIDDIRDVSYCWSRRGPYSLLRLRQLWRASLYPGVEDLDDAASEARVRDWLAFIHPEARNAEILDRNPYRVHERCVERFRVGRVLLAGDAAHLNPPSGGMGMNGGVHDAVNLADKLIAVFGGDDPALLDRYDRQRHHVAADNVIPQASANRARMEIKDQDAQLKRLSEYREISENPDACRRFLLKSSMFDSLESAAAIE